MDRTAANDVRQFVSRDPGEDLARELAAVAGDAAEIVVTLGGANYVKA